MVIFYTLLFLFEFKWYKKEIKMNKDIIGTIVFAGIIYLLVFIVCIVDYNYTSHILLVADHRWLYYVAVILLGYLSPFVVILAGLLNNVTMKLWKKYYKSKKSKN